MQKVDLKNKNLLLVLGNGYDLAAGCKTAYSDYYDDLKKRKKYIDIFNLCNSYFETYNQNMFRLAVSYMVENPSIPLWTIYFYCTTLQNDDRKGYWFDIENELRDFLTKKFDLLVNYTFLNIAPNDDEYAGIVYLMGEVIKARYYSISARPTKEWGQTKEDLSQILLEDLNAFEKDLALYLSGHYDRIIGGPDEERKRLLKLMQNVFISLDTLKICSFNYTHVPDGYDVYYPHGLCANPIIGIDLVDEGETEITKFSKSRRKSLDHSLTTYGDYLGNSKYTVAFFGLSFSFTDLNDFKIITDYLNSDFEICILYKPYKKGEDMYDPKDELIDSFKELSKNIDNLHIKNDSDFYEFKETNKIRFIDITQIESE